MKSLMLGIAMTAVLTGGTCLAQSSQSNHAASGNDNQAVATTSANAAQPAAGSNSFTRSEAKKRLERQGLSNVSDLNKDNNGVWHGKAQKDGSTGQVWLDYKGNIGVTQ
jgi:protein CpxP